MVLSRRNGKRNAQAKVQFVDMPLDILIEVRAIRKLITLTVQ